MLVRQWDAERVNDRWRTITYFMGKVNLGRLLISTLVGGKTRFVV